jgi:hypothetical protein
MNRMLGWVLLTAIAGLAFALARGWFAVGDGAGVPIADPPVDGTPPAILGPAATSLPTSPPSEAPTPDIEAVARGGEVLPPIRIGDRGRAARFRPEVFRQGMQLAGDVLLRGLVEPREVWIRWDAQPTRERFLAARFRVPGMHVLESGEAIVLVEPLVPMLRHAGFTARLEGSVLRIGGEGVYPPDPSAPDAPGRSDAPPLPVPEGPSGGGAPRPPEAPQRPGESSPR